MSDELMRTLGKLEGGVDEILRRLDVVSGNQKDHEKRIRFLERCVYAGGAAIVLLVGSQGPMVLRLLGI